MDCIPGFHLEGPYLSTEMGYFGCHPVHHLRKPSWDEFTEYQKAAGGKIIQVTISPELEGAMEFIRLCKKNGIVTAIGHTNASAEQINLAVENGAVLSTHLGNGCANLINRHKNPIWPQLANELLTPSIIADGHHLLQEEIQVFFKVKGRDNLILTSDVNHLIGMAPGKYIYMGCEVIYTEDGLVKNAELNCLAGASMPLKKGVETMMNYTGCSLSDAIKMASGNVAKIYGLDDRGSLVPGKRADIILFTKIGNQIIIKQTYLNGKQVF
jgi:N-acetylglucosamine-6-phosphate deacetylase